MTYGSEVPSIHLLLEEQVENLTSLLLKPHSFSQSCGGFSFKAAGVALLKGVGIECMRCRGETNELFEQKASRQGVVRCVEENDRC